MIPLPPLALGQRLSLLAIRMGLRSIDAVSTRAAARAAAQLFLRPPRPPFSRNVAGEAARVELSTGSGRALAWQYGAGPCVYLLHGWGGRGFQLSSFVAPLVAAGRTAVLLDAPGHGDAGGRLSSVPAFAQTLRAATDRFGPAAGVIAHSLGAMGAIVALADGLQIDRVGLLAPGSSVEEATARFQRIVALPDETIAELKRQMEARFKVSWARYSLEQLKLTVPVLAVHDVADPEVSIAETRELVRQWAGARLHETQGLGHFRPMRNPEVIAAVVQFITARA